MTSGDAATKNNTQVSDVDTNAIAEQARKDSALDRQLRKTKMCRYHLRGNCKHGSGCCFAHGSTDLARRPDLSKTQLCLTFQLGGQCNDPNCGFAHSKEELRSTNLCYKTTLCMWYMAGNCRNGKSCHFAHGETELVKSGSPKTGAPIEDKLEAKIKKVVKQDAAKQKQEAERHVGGAHRQTAVIHHAPPGLADPMFIQPFTDLGDTTYPSKPLAPNTATVPQPVPPPAAVTTNAAPLPMQFGGFSGLEVPGYAPLDYPYYISPELGSGYAPLEVPVHSAAPNYMGSFNAAQAEALAPLMAQPDPTYMAWLNSAMGNMGNGVQETEAFSALRAHVKSLTEQVQRLQEHITTESTNSGSSTRSKTGSPLSSDKSSSGRDSDYYDDLQRVRSELQRAALITQGAQMVQQAQQHKASRKHASDKNHSRNLKSLD